MAKFLNPIGDNYKKRMGLEDEDYFIEFDSTSALPVISPFDGNITHTRETNSGYVVKIEHQINNEKIESKFENLSTIYVSPGQKISKGDRVGMTGKNKLKLFINNLTTGKTERPKTWIGGAFETSFEKTSDKKEKEPESKEKESESKEKKSYGTGDTPLQLQHLLALPFAAVGSGISGILKDVKKEKKEKEENKKRKEEDKKQKEIEKQKKKEEEENNLSPDIQFEEIQKRIILEEINRIKQLLK